MSTNDAPGGQPPPDDPRTVPMQTPASPPQPAVPKPPTGSRMGDFARTVMSDSPFAGIVRPATVDMLMQVERKRRWLLIAVVLGLGCIITGGCALLLIMLSMS